MPVRSPRLTLRAIVVCALLAIMLLAIPGTASASSAGSGGWYWPVGTEQFQGWDGWWVYRSRNHSWHMAQDMPSSVGHAVYAVGDGVVLESETDKGYGGVLVVLHRTLEGIEFKAVYGHIIRRNLHKGDRVLAGQVVGTVNGSRHVHFGIHPGRAYPSDRNPYRGHTYNRRLTYGWVNPVKFLRDNPRAMAYQAPPLPRVTVVTSTVTPTFLGVALSHVYYSVPASDGAVASYHRPLCGGASSEVASDKPLPLLDVSRFAAASCATSSITVYDRLPRLSVVYSSKAPGWRSPITITGTLVNRDGKPFGGARVWLQHSTNGASWETLKSTTTGPGGRYWLQYTPSRRSLVRLRFSPATRYVPIATAKATVAPRPGLGKPCVPISPRARHGFEVAGRIRSRHAAGTHTVTLQFQRLLSGRWIDVFTRQTTNEIEDGGTRYERRVWLVAGTWRVRARAAADSAHAEENSRWVKFGVR